MGLELKRILNRETRVNICQVRTREKRWYCQPERELRGCLSCLRGDQISQLKMEDGQSISMCPATRTERKELIVCCIVVKETQDLGLKSTRQLKLKNERRRLKGLQKLCTWLQYRGRKN